MLAYWEREYTDAAIGAAKQFLGSATERIYFIMETVMMHGLARYDLPIWQWAQSDDEADQVFQRALKKRYRFATWMFSEAGFSKEQAQIRGRMMVVYMMGESTLVRDSTAKRKKLLRAKHAILTAAET